MNDDTEQDSSTPDGDSSTPDDEGLQSLVDERVERALDRRAVDPDVSRRGMLGLLTGVAGASSVGSTDRQPDSPSPGGYPDGERSDETAGDVLRAETAAEIQPAIDALAEPNDDGTQGGVVRLDAGVYEPETTIWLKAGVTLAGVGGRHHNRRNMTDCRQTVISTAGLDDEPTYRHNAEQPHPHYPLVATYRTPPMELQQREPTDEERRYWGNNVGLRDVLLDATEKRQWSESEPYFGWYDATIFSRATNLDVRNVETRGFEGYGGFYNGCVNVRDRGSLWRGGATDYHCSALTIHTAYPPDPTVYTDNSVWDVDVEGPPPTVETFTHGIRFVAGGWSNATIKATDRRFVADEDAYWNGEAPLTDPETGGNAVFKYEHGALEMDGYTITAADSVAGDVDGFVNSYQRATLRNVTIDGTDRAYVGPERRPNRIQHCTFRNTNEALHCGANLPTVHDLQIRNADVGLWLSGHVNADGTLDGLAFYDVETGIEGGNNEPVVLNYPDFRGCETPVASEFDELVLNAPVGL